MTPRLRLSVEREDEILAVAFELMMEQGFDRVTVDAVAARSGASKATLYRRWASKPELLVAAVRRRIPVPFELPEHGDFREDVLFGLRLVKRWLDENLAALQFLVEASRRDDALSEEMQRQIAGPHDGMWLGLADRWRGGPGIRPGVDLTWLHALCEGIMTNQLLPKQEPLTDEYLVRFVDEVVLPLFTQP